MNLEDDETNARVAAVRFLLFTSDILKTKDTMLTYKLEQYLQATSSAEGGSGRIKDGTSKSCALKAEIDGNESSSDEATSC